MPYGDAANMARFGADYPVRFLNGFGATSQPGRFPVPVRQNWLLRTVGSGRVVSMTF